MCNQDGHLIAFVGALAANPAVMPAFAAGGGGGGGGGEAFPRTRRHDVGPAEDSEGPCDDPPEQEAGQAILPWRSRFRSGLPLGLCDHL